MRHDESEGGSVVRAEGLAVHRVGDANAGGGIGRVRERQGSDDAQVVPVGVRQDRRQL
jgi:hypothetical protein